MQVLSCYFSPGICCLPWLEVNQGTLFLQLCVLFTHLSAAARPACSWSPQPHRQGTTAAPAVLDRFVPSADGEVSPVPQKITSELEGALPLRFAFLPERGFSVGKRHRKLVVVLPLAHLSCLRKAGRDLRGFSHD